MYVYECLFVLSAHYAQYEQYERVIPSVVHTKFRWKLKWTVGNDVNLYERYVRYIRFISGCLYNDHIKFRYEFLNHFYDIYTIISEKEL